MSSVLDQLYEVAESQGGYVTTAQAAEVGVSRQALRYLRSTGALLGVARGIHRLRRFPAGAHEDLIVAWLWAGRLAAVSHDSALVVHGIGDAMPAVIHLTTRPGFRGQRQGVVVHHAVLEPDEVVHRSGLAVTSVVRTLADVFGVDPAGAREAADEAIGQGLVRASSLGAAADRYPDARGLFEGWLDD